MLTVDWHRAPLPRSVRRDWSVMRDWRDMALTAEEADALAEIAGGASLASVDERLEGEGRRVGETLLAIWQKWCAVNKASERLQAQWRGR